MSFSPNCAPQRWQRSTESSALCGILQLIATPWTSEAEEPAGYDWCRAYQSTSCDLRIPVPIVRTEDATDRAIGKSPLSNPAARHMMGVGIYAACHQGTAASRVELAFRLARTCLASRATGASLHHRTLSQSPLFPMACVLTMPFAVPPLACCTVWWSHLRVDTK